MRIAIIGCGNMGSGLAERFSSFHDVRLYDRNEKKGQELAHRIKGKYFQNLKEAVDQAQIIFLAIKPQNLIELSHHLSNVVSSDQIVISVLAGTSLEVLRHELPTPIIVRIMPNLALRVGKGVIGIVDDQKLTTDLKQNLMELLAPLGLIYWLEEKKIDALTSLTGSGPAFMFILIEAMIEAGIAMGFQAKDAQLLILQMLQGCTTLLKETGQHPAELKWQIASPKGTTIAGIRKLEKENVRSGIIEAFVATYERAQSLAKTQIHS